MVTVFFLLPREFMVGPCPWCNDVRPVPGYANFVRSAGIAAVPVACDERDVEVLDQRVEEAAFELVVGG